MTGTPDKSKADATLEWTEVIHKHSGCQKREDVLEEVQPTPEVQFDHVQECARLETQKLPAPEVAPQVQIDDAAESTLLPHAQKYQAAQLAPRVQNEHAAKALHPETVEEMGTGIAAKCDECTEGLGVRRTHSYIRVAINFDEEESSVLWSATIACQELEVRRLHHSSGDCARAENQLHRLRVLEKRDAANRESPARRERSINHTT